MCAKHAKICNCYSEIGKFGQSLTHLKLIGGQMGGGKKICKGVSPLWCRHWWKLINSVTILQNSFKKAENSLQLCTLKPCLLLIHMF